jgi:hypothetical protein
MRAQSDPQLRRAIHYLEAIEDTEFSPMRILGMLTEFYAMLGDATKYEHYASKAKAYEQENPYMSSQNLNDALARAKAHLERRSNRTRA